MFLPCLLLGQEADSLAKQGIFDALARKQLTKITVTTNLNAFLENKRLAEYLVGKFTFQPSEDVDMTMPVKLRLRGRYRRMKCQFPPLKLKFKKDDLAENNFNEFNELKLVTHCLDDEETSRDLVNREYLVYRLFNIICENSFRAQLVDVTYRNTKGKPKKMKGRGIIIEDADEVAYRLDGIRMDTIGILDSCFNKQQENTVAMFQYMIGNTDWSCLLNRNVELIDTPEKGVMAIPYDFDFSGVVAAPYAVPKSDLGQLTVRQRIFRGYANHPDELRETVDFYLEKKEAILDEVKQFDLLSKDAKADIIIYLNEFFTIIESEETLIENLFPIEEKE